MQQQQQLLRNVRLAKATFRSAGRHTHLSLPGCGFTAKSQGYFSSCQTTVICKSAFLSYHRVVQGWLFWKYNLENVRPESLRWGRDLVKGVLHSLSPSYWRILKRLQENGKLTLRSNLQNLAFEFSTTIREAFSLLYTSSFNINSKVIYISISMVHIETWFSELTLNS